MFSVKVNTNSVFSAICIYRHVFDSLSWDEASDNILTVSKKSDNIVEIIARSAANGRMSEDYMIKELEQYSIMQYSSVKSVDRVRGGMVV